MNKNAMRVNMMNVIIIPARYRLALITSLRFTENSSSILAEVVVPLIGSPYLKKTVSGFFYRYSISKEETVIVGFLVGIRGLQNVRQISIQKPRLLEKKHK